MTHPDLTDIDALRLGHGRDEDAAHVRDCAECRQVLADLEGLGSDLKAAQAKLAVPDEVDQRLLWLARKRALAIRRTPRRWMRRGWAVAAAAIVVIGISSLLSQRLDQPQQSFEVAAPAPPSVRDVDGDGRVDILDAFALARAGGDPAEVESLAQRAVAIGGA